MCIFTFLSIAQFYLVYSLSGTFLTSPPHSSTDNLPIDMVYIKGDTFQMGDSFGDDEEGNEILHPVQLKDYLIGKCEVNFSAYDAFCKATQRQFLNDLGRGRGKQPVVNVDWFDAIEYCNWRSLKEGLKLVYKMDKSQIVPPNAKKGAKNWAVSIDSLANGYRLPTEAEWEFAARERGRQIRFGNGQNTADPAEINFLCTRDYRKHYSMAAESRTSPLPIGSLLPNALGLYDISGNVAEWCQDWHHDYLQSKSDTLEYTSRIIRGGGFSSGPEGIRCSNRGWKSPAYKDGYTGFRLARSAKGIKPPPTLPGTAKPQVPDSTHSDLVLIKGGTFQMGDVMGDFSDLTNSEKPHTVTLSDFYIAKKELTFEAFDVFCRATKRDLPSDAGWGRGKYPVVNISWFDAIEYCNWRSEQEGLLPFYSIDKDKIDPNNEHSGFRKKWLVETNPTASGYRLPTEAEWEFAARQRGQKIRFGNGKDSAQVKMIHYYACAKMANAHAEIGQCPIRALRVGSFPPNALGLYDMSGNVSEWCHNWSSSQVDSLSLNPMGPKSGFHKSTRGGSWFSNADFVRVASRLTAAAANKGEILGLRLVRSKGNL